MSPSTPLAFSLDDPALTLSIGGGKARNLGVMRRAGLPVPPGFVLSTDAYRTFVSASALEARILEALTGAAASGDVERASATLRAAFEAAPLPERVAAEVRRSCATMGAVAVRSSATAEDLPDASFAGQQDTYLNVSGEEAILHAVRRCWASLWTARAMAYRARHSIDPRDLALAVVVQEMAPASAAGVLFTVHPMTGRLDRMVINATWGLGEALVAGRVNPDSFVVDKATGRPLRIEIGEKRAMTSPVAEGTAEVPVEEGLRGRRALDDGQLVLLAGLGRRLEALFGGPQDVEWAIVAGAPVLLQSRPVTSASSVPGDDAWPPTERGAPQPFDFWTRQDMGERWPDPVSPLTWSISEPLNQRIMDGAVAGLKAPHAGNIRWSCRAMGHVYMNEGAMLHVYTHDFGMPIALMASTLTHPGARPEGADGWRLGRVLSHLPFFWRAAVGWEKDVARFESEFPQIDAWVDDFMATPLDALDDASLVREATQTWYPRIVHYVAHHTGATALAMSSYRELEEQVERATGDPTLAQLLVGGISGVIAAEMGDDLAALAETIRSSGLEETVLARPPLAALAALRGTPDAAPFFAALARFLSRHGHRCMVEAELRYPRWSESPEQVIEQLLPYLRGAVKGGMGSQARQRREEATAGVMAGLGFWGRKAMERKLARAHRFTRMRDNGQSYIVKLLLPLRRLLACLGQRWAGRGWLRTADDVFFLVLEDMNAILDAGTPEAALVDLQGRVDARRLAHDHWSAQPAPYALDAALDPAPPAVEEGDPDTLVGVAASRGTVTGRARVVLRPDEASRLEPGDILVTRATDPGWTPAFSIIGGAVLEIGGVLSHGAIVAREYGLPAVVNVPDATRRIEDGQIITVDGSTGKVVLSARP